MTTTITAPVLVTHDGLVYKLEPNDYGYLTLSWAHEDRDPVTLAMRPWNEVTSTALWDGALMLPRHTEVDDDALEAIEDGIRASLGCSDR